MISLFKMKKYLKEQRFRDEDGYTLLELLVVLAILGLVLGVAAPMMMKQFGAAKSKTASIQVRALSSNLEFFMLDVGRYPTEDEGLNALSEKPSGLNTWNGPYVSQSTSLADPWGNIYVYKPRKSELPAFEITSLGADGKVGGEGEDRDISNLD